MKFVYSAAAVLLATGAWSRPVLAGGIAGATPQDARAAVQRSLPYIENAGTDWMREKKCNSCHVVTFQVWAFNEAAARGLDVDRKKLAEWVQWSLANSLADNYWFQLRPQAKANLKAGGMSDVLLAKLKTLKSGNFTKETDFLAALEKALGREDLEKFKEPLLREGALPKNGGGPDTLAQILLGRGQSAADQGTADSYHAIRSLLLEWQEPDGAWLAQGQLPGLKWTEQEMHDATTLWNVLAVGAIKPADDILSRSRQKALESLKKSEPGITLQSLALHLIVAHEFGGPARMEALLEKFLDRQNVDGGWSWVAENTNSDAFATGQALYALGRLGRDGNDPAVHRAWEFLLRSQGKDGSWEVPQNLINKQPRKLNVYNFWGTAWAAIGLLNTLPPDKPPAVTP